jgi:heme exporter protein D
MPVMSATSAAATSAKSESRTKEDAGQAIATGLAFSVDRRCYAPTMRLIDFSSWQGVLSTLTALVIVTVIAVGIRLLVMQRVQNRRERQNRQINERLKTLIAAYKTLGARSRVIWVWTPRTYAISACVPRPRGRRTPRQGRAVPNAADVFAMPLRRHFPT